MNDRELLEAAAKAAGIVERIEENWSEGELPYFHTSTGLWRPLEDDGDALRLAVMLNLRIWPNFNGSHADCFRDDQNIFTQYIEGDPFAATRRAIVCAAADVGVIHE
jgi:hypothetical protein